MSGWANLSSEGSMGRLLRWDVVTESCTTRGWAVGWETGHAQGVFMSRIRSRLWNLEFGIWNLEFGIAGLS